MTAPLAAGEGSGVDRAVRLCRLDWGVLGRRPVTEPAPNKSGAHHRCSTQSGQRDGKNHWCEVGVLCVGCIWVWSVKPCLGVGWLAAGLEAAEEKQQQGSRPEHLGFCRGAGHREAGGGVGEAGEDDGKGDGPEELLVAGLGAGGRGAGRVAAWRGQRRGASEPWAVRPRESSGLVSRNACWDEPNVSC